MNLVNSVAPHVKSKTSTFKQMMEVFICLGVLWIASMIFYLVKRDATHFGFVILNGVISILTSVFSDALYNLPLLFKKDFEGNRFKEYLYRLIHSYSYITGLILALFSPIGIKWWEILITAFLSTFVMKLLFGGFGKNILNPAIFGRVFAQFAFTRDLTTYVGNPPSPLDINTGASLTNTTSGFANIMFDDKFNILKVLIGDYYGALGETFAILLILICVYLCIRQIIDWRVPVFYIGSLYIAFVIMFLSMGCGGFAFRDAIVYTCAGGILFGGVFCLTDPVTSPTSRSGRVIFALVAAILTFTIRTFAKASEGVACSIIIVNCLVPLIDRIIEGRTRKNLVPTIICASCGVILFVLSLTYGLITPIDSSTGEFIKKLAGGIRI